MRRLWAALWYWLDPQSRRPLVVLAVLAMLLFLAPLMVDVVWAVFFKLSPRIRWWLGELMFVGLLALGVRRLLTVRPGDGWPASDATTRVDPAGRWIAWVLRLAVVTLLVPILPRRGYLGFADWDFVLDKFEAVRQTILYWGQFPWWNPWCRGGFPLAAEPQIGAVSIATPFLLGFGTTTGLAVAAGVCRGQGVEGAHRLGRLWLVDCWAAAAVALVYGLNGAVLVNTAWGYVLPMSYCSLPWIVYHSFRLVERWSSALWLGAWLSFAVLNGIQYLNLYAGVLAGMVWLRALRLAAPAKRRLLGIHTVAALGMCLAICGWRLGPVLEVLADDQREQISFWDESLLAVPHYLLQRPAANWPAVIPAQHAATFAELTCYVGPVVVVLGLASLGQGWRWWHTLTLVTTALAIGSIRWYHPSHWVATWPLSVRGGTRPRLGVGECAGAASRVSRQTSAGAGGGLGGVDRSGLLGTGAPSIADRLQRAARTGSLSRAGGAGHREREDGSGVSRHDEAIWGDPGVRTNAGRLPSRCADAAKGPGGRGLPRRSMDCRRAN
jgi:hypothetical protein